MGRRLELGLAGHNQTVLIQRRDSGAVSIFISLPQVSLLLESTEDQARQLAAYLLDCVNGVPDDAA